MADTLELLGKLVDGDPGRDAVHIAVAPAEAGEPLKPGTHVGIGHDGRAYPLGVFAIGVVDPFLRTKVVRSGQRFWLLLYPGTITSLRHEWTHPHPAFSREEKSAVHSKEASERWLRQFIDRADCPSYETVIAAAADVAGGSHNSWDADHLHFNDKDAHGEIPPEFWDHVEVVLGRKIAGRRPRYFSCSC